MNIRTRKFICLFLLLLVVGSLLACSTNDAQKLDPRTVLGVTQIESGAFLLDVRSSEEFQSGHISGAHNISYDVIADNLELLPRDKTKPIVVYCRSGRRSALSKSTLENHGYTNIVDAGAYSELKAALGN